MALGIPIRFVLFLAVACPWTSGCNGGDGAGSDADGGAFIVGERDGGPFRCVDEDGDGFDTGCYAGANRDCDDGDPEITDECFRCQKPDSGCPCDPGTKPRDCKPDDIQVVGGYLSCPDGAMFCRDGKWSACEAIGEYTFVKE
jgi:hypothetical protein